MGMLSFESDLNFYPLQNDFDAEPYEPVRIGLACLQFESRNFRLHGKGKRKGKKKVVSLTHFDRTIVMLTLFVVIRARPL